MASEKFANLAETTLAASYTSGTTTLSVASAAGFPTVGVFRVRLGNTGKTIWRVDSVSGTTFTGAAEANDANANSGDAVKIVASRAVAERFTQSPESGDIRLPSGVSAADFYGPIFKVTPMPDVSSWTWVNQGAAAFTQANGHVWLRKAGTGAGNNLTALVKSQPSTPYTITVGLIVRALSAGGYVGPGICFRESGSGELFVMVLAMSTAQVNEVIDIHKQNSATSFNSTKFTCSTAHRPAVAWLRISNDGSTLRFSYSHDKVNWVELTNEAVGTFLTPNQVGLVFYNEGSNPESGATYISWEEA
jgi:hypothetical protein